MSKYRVWMLHPFLQGLPCPSPHNTGGWDLGHILSQSSRVTRGSLLSPQQVVSGQQVGIGVGRIR